MSKQVEVPPELVDKAETVLDRAAEERMRTLMQDRRPGEPVQTISHRSVAEEITALAYKHFSDRLLSDEAIEAAGRASRTFVAFSPTSPQTWEAVPDRDKAAIREAARIYIAAALQATSTPEVDRG